MSELTWDIYVFVLLAVAFAITIWVQSELPPVRRLKQPRTEEPKLRKERIALKMYDRPRVY